jgi:hypothetical protein
VYVSSDAIRGRPCCAEESGPKQRASCDQGKNSRPNDREKNEKRERKNIKMRKERN